MLSVKARLVSGAVLVFAVGVWVVITNTKSPIERKLLSALEQGAIFRIIDNGVAALGPRAAHAWAVEAKDSGLDLFSLYLASREDRPKRKQIAYLLLVLRSREYVAFAASHIDELDKGHEFRVWSFLLIDLSHRLPAAYVQDLLAVMAKVNRPYAALTVARNTIAGGDVKEAVEQILDVYADSPLWSVDAYDLMKTLPTETRIALLLDYMEGSAARAVAAASLLSDEQDHKARAIDRLRELMTGADDHVSQLARRMYNFAIANPGG